MANLISPGVSVQVIDESIYIPGRIGTIPLIYIATAEEKSQENGDPAIGTYESGVIRTVTSLRQSLELYGIPKYYDTGGAIHYGDARNEFGLDALNKYLEVGNRAYVIRANVNLNDNLEDIKDLWQRKISIAADYLNALVSDWLDQYNEVNNYVPADPEYKTTVDGDTLLVLLNEALKEVFNSFSFSQDLFRIEFVQDHTIAQPGFADVIYNGDTGFVQLNDILGLDSDQEYSASITVTHTGGTDTFVVELSGDDVTTFGDLIDAINLELGGAAVATLVQGRIRITSDLAGATSAVVIVQDGATGFLPLFSSVNLFERFATPVPGRGVNTLAIYDETYQTIVGSYEGLEGLISTWNIGSVEPTEFTPSEAEGLLIDAAEEFDNTKEFKFLTSLGENDAAKRAVIVQQLQAIINNPNTGARAEGLEYDLVVCPGYPETTDELTRLAIDMLEEVFVIGETPLDKPPVGPNSIVNWARSPAKVANNGVGYWYGHGISSNIDGRDVLTTAASTALRTLAYSDRETAPWFAPAGTSRGLCPHLVNTGYLSGDLGGPATFVENFLDVGTRDALYEEPVMINPITFIPGSGILVYGQKTTSPVSSALDRINVSRLVKYIKRQVRKGLYPFVFEPNDQITRDNVVAAVNSLMSPLLTRRALYDFAVICDESNNSPDTIDRNELYVDIAIQPVRAVEFIYARIRVQRTGANLTGNITGGNIGNR